MRNNFICVIYALCVCINLVQPHNVDTEHPWDLLIFTQSWPATVCKEWKEHDHTHKCNLPKNENSWTIHGIWPTKLGTIGPAFCNRTWLFDVEEVRPIENFLQELWTNIERGTSTYALWAHEWNKHGTCAAMIEPLNSQLKYFSTGLNWAKKFLMYDILKEASIIPSNDQEYSVVDISNAIKLHLGVNPVVECRKEDGKSYLGEIRICFSKTLELRDCDGVLNMEATMIGNNSVLTNCKSSEGIIYLHDPSNTMYVQLYKLVMWLQWLTL